MGLSAMSRATFFTGRIDFRVARGAGFSLIELMVAITLGALLTVGIVTLFGATSTTNKVQDALARLQENGRYAVTRITDDLRMGSAQYCESSTSQGWTISPNDGPIYPALTILSNANGVSTGASNSFPDSGGLLGVLPGPGATYPVGAANFMRGYDCSTAGGCTPAVPAGAAPNAFAGEGLGDGLRVRGADVLTMRYQRGTGWNFVVGGGSPAALTLTPAVVGGQQMDDPVNFVSGDRALLLSCGGGQIFQVAAAGNALNPTGLLNSSTYKPSATVGSFDVRVFNFSRDFLTVTYYLANKADPDTPGRLIPTLYRRQNGTQVDELVQGVERLDFLYGVQYKDSSLHYLTADLVNANSTAANCSPPSQGLGLAAGTVEPGCLWRSVMTVEVHLLLDTVDNIGLAPADMAYRYTGTTGDTTMHIPPAPAQPMPNGLPAGLMMRREFIASVAMRNGNH
jgi:type IV pilus assembly protein PilW